MRLSNDAYWQLFVNTNITDPMGIQLINKTENWANAMEVFLAKNESIAEVAERTSSEFFDPSLGHERIMLASALQALIHSWEYGTELQTLFDNGWYPAEIRPVTKSKYVGNESNRLIDPNVIRVMMEKL